MAGPFISFLTDFGGETAPAICRGVIWSIAADARILDLNHGIRRHAIRDGAFLLSRAIGYLPVGVHLAVVDPGVGGARRPLALRSGDGRLFVGPDNGLLVPAAEQQGGIEAAHELANPSYALDSVSRTFHGRDLFAPAAAYLATGVAIDELGPPLAVDALARLEIPKPDIGENRIRSTVLYIDRFGNVQLNLTRAHLEQAEVTPGTTVEIELGLERYYAVAARAFADARKGDVILYEDSYRNIALALSGGNAAELFGVGPGQEVRIRTRGF
jgi:S-adenosylmethionine hydrolase